jgi:hypothetical protein
MFLLKLIKLNGRSDILLQILFDNNVNIYYLHILCLNKYSMYKNVFVNYNEFKLI